MSVSRQWTFVAGSREITCLSRIGEHPLWVTLGKLWSPQLLYRLWNLFVGTSTYFNFFLLQIGLTHSNLLKQWRDRAVSGQTEARRVLAEMLTPSGGARSNCYKFISWVTGCSHSTIGRVNEQMKATGKLRTDSDCVPCLSCYYI